MTAEKRDMSSKKPFRNRTAFYWVMFFVLAAATNFLLLNNAAFRNGTVEFLLPILERFLHQVEMDISSIGMDVFS